MTGPNEPTRGGAEGDDAARAPAADPPPWEKPELTVEPVYETSALSCQKVDAMGGCSNPLFQKFS